MPFPDTYMAACQGGRKSMSTELLFVYGTLRRSYRLDGDKPHPMHRLLAHHARFIDDGECAGRLFNLGSYPGLVPALSPDERVKGELYQLEQSSRLLALLDEYEDYKPGAPALSEYLRVRMTVRGARLGLVPAWVYTYNRRPLTMERIHSGDFCQANVPG
ncbi:MAG: gamma-glutamylcyclotransferase [Porticoccaceae bacterium]|nr:gamma-glutamylcyclotransferase [Porticoccaceae bacterium]